MIEKFFDIPFVSNLALREKQIQQNYRPVIGVHKWFARRPGTLFRSLILSEFVDGKLMDSYYNSHCLDGITVADPFMGGGTPLLEANRLGCNIIGADINPMAYWIVKQEISLLDLDAYRLAAGRLISELKEKVEIYYQTRCTLCGKTDVPVKYFLWVKTQRCLNCNNTFDLFPSYLISTNQRHPFHVLICPACGELNETDNPKAPGACMACKAELRLQGPARNKQCSCPHCNTPNRYPQLMQGSPKHRMIAIEYYCPQCKPNYKGRFFKKPEPADLEKYDQASLNWSGLTPIFVPEEDIPAGDETDRLHRWGYRRYSEMFNDRQLLGLELSCQIIADYPPGEVRDALATNLSDLLRYQNMLCRYDTSALKSLDIFSVHGFPVGLIQCESNLLGIPNGLKGSNIGSGGWSNIIEKYARGKDYCYEPFEIKHLKGRKVQVPIPGEWIGPQLSGSINHELRRVELHCKSSTEIKLPPGSIDAIFTDPPYFANVQYAELMDFCYVWLRLLVRQEVSCFDRISTRDESELTGNNTMERGLAQFTKGLSVVFQNMAKALKPGFPFVFTYHHNRLEAYFPAAVAILDARLACSATIPCPAEMGASIHINGTGSSIIDTVFVCRSTGTVPRNTIVSNSQAIAQLVRKDMERLRDGNVKVSQGDIRCITYGHLIRLAIWFLRDLWEQGCEVEKKLLMVRDQVEKLGGWSEVMEHLSPDYLTVSRTQEWAALDESETYGRGLDEISF